MTLVRQKLTFLDFGSNTPILGAKILAAHYPGVEKGSAGVHWGSKTAHRVLTIAEVIRVFG